MKSRVETIIDDIEEYIDSCKYTPLSSSKVVVNKEEIGEFLRELRFKIPEEITRYKKVVQNKDAILGDAHSKSEKIIDEANIKAKELVSENEITRQAKEQADSIIDEANQKADMIIGEANEQSEQLKNSAITYADSLLANVENILSRALDIYGSKYEELMTGLSDSYETVRNNRKELNVANMN